MTLKVMYWHPCHGSRELLSGGWPVVAALIIRHAARARAAGLTLQGWCHDNPFQKHHNDASSNPDEPTTCFDQFPRCRRSADPVYRMISSLAGWHGSEQRIAAAFSANGHGTEAEVYGGPPWAGIEANEIADAMLPFMGPRRYFHWNDGAADLTRQDADWAVMSVQRGVCSVTAGVEAIPVPSSIFNRPDIRAFATYMAAVRAQPVECPLSILYRGANEEAPIQPGGGRGEPVPLTTAIQWCQSHNATLYLNIGLCDAATLATIAGAQGTAVPADPANPGGVQ